jgi:formylglycine-generating enzyme required for sulfatase activity
MAHKLLIVMLLVTNLTACSSAAPTAMPISTTATLTTPTATPVLPTATPIPPTALPISATPTFAPSSRPTSDGVVNGWAVLAEKDSYDDVKMTNLPIGYTNTLQLRQVLLGFGWPASRIREVREFDQASLRQSLDWLANNADADDVVLLYVAAHGKYMTDVVRWSDFIAADWAAVPSQRRVLVMDTCQASALTTAVKGDSRSYLAIAAVDKGEYGWSGLEEEKLPIIGGVFTHYFAAAFNDSKADADGNGQVSIQEAARQAETQQRAYMHDVVLAVPEFLEGYHKLGSYPERDPGFPHVIVDDAIGEPVYLKLDARTSAAPAKLGDTWARPADEMTMVYVPAGEFKMGSDDDGIKYARQLCKEYGGDDAIATCKADAFADEQPAHTVALDGFWIDRTEVTNRQYQRCVEAKACTPPVDSSSYMRESYFGNVAYDIYPVVWVTQQQAANYCQWAGARLPTEAEWEYAARGPEGRTFPWGNTFDGKRLNYCDVNCTAGPNDKTVDDGYTDTAPVASFPTGASWCGALDLAGNVREWVADWYGRYPSVQQVNPTGPISGTSRIPRGGCWLDTPDDVRSTNRGENSIDYTRHKVGLRCASY